MDGISSTRDIDTNPGCSALPRRFLAVMPGGTRSQGAKHSIHRNETAMRMPSQVPRAVKKDLDDDNKTDSGELNHFQTADSPQTWAAQDIQRYPNTVISARSQQSDVHHARSGDGRH